MSYYTLNKLKNLSLEKGDKSSTKLLFSMNRIHGDIYSGILNRHQSMNNSYNVKEISPKIVNVEVWGVPQSPTPTEFLNNYSIGTTVNNSSYLEKDGVTQVPNLKQFSTIRKESYNRNQISLNCSSFQNKSYSRF